MIVKDETRVAEKEYEEEIFAVNFFKNTDEITESIARDTDLKTWANASAWSLEDGKARWRSPMSTMTSIPRPSLPASMM